MSNPNCALKLSAMILGAMLFLQCARAEDFSGTYKGTGKETQYNLLEGKPFKDGGPVTATLVQAGLALTLTLDYGTGYVYTLKGSIGNGAFIATGQSNSTDEKVIATGHIAGSGSKAKIKGSAFFYVSDPASSGDQHVYEDTYSVKKQ